MKIKFDKMQGLGNDFVVINAYHQDIHFSKEQIRHLADRHYGVGCDQLLVLRKPFHPEAEFGYQIFNANGEEVGQCGNGARCLASFIHYHQISTAKKIRLSTLTSHLEVELMEDNQVRVNMGMPRFKAEEVPANTEHLLKHGWRQSTGHQQKLIGYLPVANELLPAGMVSMGNPHMVLTVANLEDLSASSVGREFSISKIFPEQCNIGFMQVLDAEQIALKVYERHVGETKACGSGACAAMVVGRVQGFLNDTVRVKQAGGDLIITWQGEGQPLWMQGPAKRVFSGEIEL